MSTLTDAERDDLRAAVRHLLDRASSSEAVRSLLDDPAGYDEELWRRLVELGWTGIHVPEAYGGGGAGYADVAVVLHELGRHLTAGPFLASAVLGTTALMACDNDELRADLLPSLVAGDRRATVAIANDRGSVDPRRLGVAWEHAGTGIRLRGTTAFVPDAAGADTGFVAARADDGTPALVAVDLTADGVTCEATPTIDPTRRLSRLTLDSVVDPASLLCAPGPSAVRAIERLAAVGAIAVACDAAGAAERMLELTAGYAKDRVQFGRPIGSFQAVKHHCADMAVAVEGSRAAVAVAAEALDGPEDATLAAAVTTSYAGPACSDVCAVAIQVHGGIGFTWEHDAHLYLKRAKLDEAWFGTPSWHRRRLADAVFPRVLAVVDR